jgi:hypothetical protein
MGTFARIGLVVLGIPFLMAAMPSAVAASYNQALSTVVLVVMYIVGGTMFASMDAE